MYEVRPASPAPDGAGPTSETFVQGYSSVDVLFVVDNSFGMGPIQDALAGGITPLLQRMALGKLDWRIGVISTDMGIAPFSGPGCPKGGGDGGELQTKPRKPGCTPPPDPYITPTNVGDAAAAFACIAALGTGGCGFERHFDAVLQALTPGKQPALNKGFLRDAALLMVVWVTNEDDCSAADPRIYDPDYITLGAWTSYRCFDQDIACGGKAADGSLTGCVSGSGSYLRPVKTMVQQLRSLKPSGSVAVLALTGPPRPVRVQGGSSPALQPSCTEAAGAITATPAIRLHELADQLGADGVAVSVCSDNLGDRLAEAVGSLRTTAGPYCLAHALEDPSRPGCSVVAVTPAGARLVLPPAVDGSPGFRIIHPVIPACKNGALVFDAAAAPPAGSEVTVTCAFK